jgi:hypothetical protein
MHAQQHSRLLPQATDLLLFVILLALLLLFSCFLVAATPLLATSPQRQAPQQVKQLPVPPQSK